jgi:pyridoxamine 5'-phosphate oxidase
MSENNDFTPPSEPWTLFAEWVALAEAHEVNDANAMSVATIGKDDWPSVRIVLMKDYDPHGFVFYTNRQSHKGQQLAAHPKAGICFHWKSIRRQVRAEGAITLTTDAESDEYFASRPRGSQIGAWASQQSSPLVSRAVLEESVREIEAAYEGRAIPRPTHWGGYRLSPMMIEFWQDRQYRLHDRIVYHRHDAHAPWKIERVYP